jgi:hypothetical protein
MGSGLDDNAVPNAAPIWSATVAALAREANAGVIMTSGGDAHCDLIIALAASPIARGVGSTEIGGLHRRYAAWSISERR